LGFVEAVDALQLAFTKNRRLRVWRQKEEKMSPTPVGQLVQLPSFAAEAAKPRHKQLRIQKSDNRSKFFIFLFFYFLKNFLRTPCEKLTILSGVGRLWRPLQRARSHR
jgi:hypothetical protein